MLASKLLISTKKSVYFFFFFQYNIYNASIHIFDLWWFLVCFSFFFFPLFPETYETWIWMWEVKLILHYHTKTKKISVWKLQNIFKEQGKEQTSKCYKDFCLYLLFVFFSHTANCTCSITLMPPDWTIKSKKFLLISHQLLASFKQTGGYLIHVYKYLMERNWEDGARFFSVVGTVIG